MVIRIDALDTLFFRDGKPFARGEETWADTLFPPFPSVLYGALRSKYFAEHPSALSKASQADDPTKTLRITNMYLALDDQAYFVMPLDFVEKKNKKKEFAIPLSLVESNEVVSSCPTSPRLLEPSIQNEPVEEIENGLLVWDDWQKYLNGKVENIFYHQLNDYITLEPKVGIGRNDLTHIAEESHLYRVGMYRLSARRKAIQNNTTKLSLVVAFEGLQIPEQGFLRLGGEGKGAYYIKTTEVKSSSAHFALNKNSFKVVLTTPAIFTKGWLPNWLDENTLIGEVNGLKLHLLTAVIGKTRAIGGFDMVKRYYKPMHYAVPAGSVYYFEVLDHDKSANEVTTKLMEAFHGKCISDKEATQGFGLTFLGRIA